MRIAIVTPVLGSAGGMGRVAEEFARRLAARGHEVTVFAPGRSGRKNRRTEEQDGSYVLRFLNSYVRFGHAAWLPSLAKNLDGFDLIHLHYPFIGGAGAVLRSKQRVKTPLVVTYHMDLVGRRIGGIFFEIYSRLTTPRILRIADLVTISSQDYSESSSFAGIFKNLGARLAEIPFGVDTERFAPRAPDGALLSKLGIAPEESVILFVGGLDAAHYFKGVPTLLRAFAFFRKEAANVRLVIVGSGNRQKDYARLAERLFKKSGHPEGAPPVVGATEGSPVIFASAVAGEELPRYYSVADLVILPSTTRSEAFGLVLLEAQASGVPVIASALPGVRTVLKDKETGLLVPPKDYVALMRAIAWMLTHSEERQRMGEAARQLVMEKYQWKTAIDKLEEAYGKILNSKL